MASPEMTAKRRRSLPKSVFGLPGKRKYPMDTRGRAANAKSRASQQVGKSITEDQKAEIDAKADRILAKKRGGFIMGGAKRPHLGRPGRSH